MAGASFMRALMKQSSWYFICNALNNGLAIILLPFLSRYLSTEEYGIVQLSTGIGLFLPMLFCGGIDKAIYRFYLSMERLSVFFINRTIFIIKCLRIELR